MKFKINKKVILEEVTTERKLARIPILMGAGALIHGTVGSGIESAMGDNITPEDVGKNALIGAGVGGVLGGINYFRDKGVGPTSLLAQAVLPVKPNEPSKK